MLQHHEVSGVDAFTERRSAQYRHSKVGTARQIRPQRTPLGVGREETSATARGSSSALITENAGADHRASCTPATIVLQLDPLLLRMRARKLRSEAVLEHVLHLNEADVLPTGRNRRLHLEA